MKFAVMDWKCMKYTVITDMQTLHYPTIEDGTFADSGGETRKKLSRGKVSAYLLNSILLPSGRDFEFLELTQNIRRYHCLHCKIILSFFITTVGDGESCLPFKLSRTELNIGLCRVKQEAV